MRLKQTVLGLKSLKTKVEFKSKPDSVAAISVKLAVVVSFVIGAKSV